MDTITSLAGDTIVAIATAPGRGGIGIIRLSGPRSGPIGETICQQPLTPRQATYSGFYESDGESALDAGIVIFFTGPHSFTGEDVVELQAHGGPVILDLLLKACCDQGARLARAGEFSERAFLNNKLDLAQAEAIADLINSTTETAARSASRSLQGAFSEAINTLSQQILQLRIYVEAAIDFPEEEIDFIKEGEVSQQLDAIRQQLNAVLRTAKQGSLLRDGIKLVIAGKPNAGKSSLLNALSGQETAIVTPIEGTTRDVLREHIQIDGIPLHIVDTAGLRSSEDTVEQEGIRRAWQEIQTADHILLVTDIDAAGLAVDDPDSMWPELHQQVSVTIPVTIIRNKCDLANTPAGIRESSDQTIITLSAKTGSGIDLLKQHIKQVMGYQATNEQQFLARRRHLEALQRSQAFLQQGQQQLSTGGAAELLAEDLRQAHQCLGEITGAMSSDELLGEIFSSFCIGK